MPRKWHYHPFCLGLLNYLIAPFKYLVELIEEAASFLYNFAKSMWDAFVNGVSPTMDFSYDVRGGSQTLFKDGEVYLDIFLNMFGYEKTFNLFFCVPTSLDCLKKLVTYAWKYIQCQFSCCSTDNGNTYVHKFFPNSKIMSHFCRIQIVSSFNLMVQPDLLFAIL